MVVGDRVRSSWFRSFLPLTRADVIRSNLGKKWLVLWLDLELYGPVEESAFKAGFQGSPGFERASYSVKLAFFPRESRTIIVHSLILNKVTSTLVSLLSVCKPIHGVVTQRYTILPKKAIQLLYGVVPHLQLL